MRIKQDIVRDVWATVMNIVRLVRSFTRLPPELFSSDRIVTALLLLQIKKTFHRRMFVSDSEWLA